ncbi:hypothetical protein A7X67_18185 [Clostridium sp. W14A]|nr:hypothetical protein A7X67_18185 [Clostridium sp. W14A]
MKMIYRKMEEADIQKVIPLYMEYYNYKDNSCWTKETTYKRIHQVWSREDSHCLVLENNEVIIGFAMGYFEQYDDLVAYDLIEIVIALAYQNKGFGTALMLELERQVKSMGASMIQLQAVNDEKHNRFYGRLQYKDVGNLILKAKWQLGAD